MHQLARSITGVYSKLEGSAHASASQVYATTDKAAHLQFCSQTARAQRRNSWMSIVSALVLCMSTLSGPIPDRKLDEFTVLLNELLQLLFICQLIGILLQVKGHPGAPLQGLPTVSLPHLFETAEHSRDPRDEHKACMLMSQ